MQRLNVHNLVNVSSIGVTFVSYFCHKLFGQDHGLWWRWSTPSILLVDVLGAQYDRVLSWVAKRCRLEWTRAVIWLALVLLENEEIVRCCGLSWWRSYVDSANVVMARIQILWGSRCEFCITQRRFLLVISQINSFIYIRATQFLLSHATSTTAVPLPQRRVHRSLSRWFDNQSILFQIVVWLFFTSRRHNHNLRILLQFVSSLVLFIMLISIWADRSRKIMFL